MSDERFNALEEKLAYQEDTTKALNDVLYEQQRRIDALEAICNQLLARLNGLAEAGGIEGGISETESQPPPHY
ncbi:MAG: SlyX family protein [Porticoccaceae bacterium]